MKLLILFFLSTTAFATTLVPSEKEIIQKLDIWGICYSGLHCQGGVITNGVTGEECQHRGGHSLFMPNSERCFNL